MAIGRVLQAILRAMYTHALATAEGRAELSTSPGGWQPSMCYSGRSIVQVTDRRIPVLPWVASLVFPEVAAGLAAPHGVHASGEPCIYSTCASSSVLNLRARQFINPCLRWGARVSYCEPKQAKMGRLWGFLIPKGNDISRLRLSWQLETARYRTP